MTRLTKPNSMYFRNFLGQWLQNSGTAHVPQPIGHWFITCQLLSFSLLFLFSVAFLYSGRTRSSFWATWGKTSLIWPWKITGSQWRCYRKYEHPVCASHNESITRHLLFRRIPLLRLFPSPEMVESSLNSISPKSEKRKRISRSHDQFSDFFEYQTLDILVRGSGGLAPLLGHREHSSRYPGQVRLS